MAFRELELSNKAASSDQTGVTAGLSKIKGNKARMRLTLRSNVMTTLNWVPKTSFKVLVGTGDDLGTLRFVPKEGAAGSLKERKLPHSGETAWVISLCHVSDLPDIIAPSEVCLWEAVDGSTLEVLLPAWSRRKHPATGAAASIAGETELQRQNREAAERRKRMGM